MSFILPMGFDRADGVTPLPLQPLGSSGSPQPVGTPNAVGSVVIQSASNPVGFTLQEAPDSPEIERAEQATASHTMREMFWAIALQFIAGLGRGTYVSDSFGNIWRILSSKIKSIKAGNAELSYVAESISFDTPPDDFQDIPQDLGIDIIKYPRYFYNLYPQAGDYSAYPYPANPTVSRAMVKNAIIRAIQTYRDSPYFPPAGSTSLNGTVGSSVINAFITGIIPTVTNTSSGNETAININGDPPSLLAVAAASEIINKLWFQLDTPYIAGRQVTWTQYFFQPVYLNPGGYIEDPTYWVPDYFMQPSMQSSLARGSLAGGTAWINNDTLPPLNGTGGVGGSTVFDKMAAINPTCYSSNGTTTGVTNISWLRKADEVVYERTWFKVTHTWVGSPVGHWDDDIYSQNNRPTNVTQYNTTFPAVG